MRGFRLLLVATLLAVAISMAAPGDDAAVEAASGYSPLPAPARLLDTRPGQSTADGRFAGGGAIDGGRFLALQVAGRAGIPRDPGSVVLNVTATGSGASGYVAAWPCDRRRPPTANLNYAPGQTIANTVVSRVAPDGTVCFFVRSTVHLVVDASGVLPADAFRPLAAPQRLADTRAGGTTVDGRFRADGRRGAGSVYEVAVAGRGDVPGGATAAVLNIAVTGPLDRGYLTIYPCDKDRPLAANLTYAPGQTIPNAVMTRLDGRGRICIFTRAATDLVVDVTGVLPDGVFSPLPAPRRIADTRAGQRTADREFEGGGLQPAGGTLQLDVVGRVGIPATATAVVLNVTSTASTANGFVTAHPQGTGLPTAANLNFPAGVNVSNLVVAGVGSQGDVCLFTRSPTHLVVDVVGWMVGPTIGAGEASCPSLVPTANIDTLRSAYVRRAPLQRAVGADRIAIVICKVPTNSSFFGGGARHDVTPNQAAAFLNREVAPWFAAASRGRYSVRFEGAGTIQLSASETSDDCRARAAASAPARYTGVLGVDDTSSGGGFAGPGLIFGDPSFDTSVLDQPANRTRRSGWLGGANVSTRENPAAFAHELGHMLHWPHSFIGPGFEYDNWLDLMSRGQGWCNVPGNSTLYNCDPGNTLAFNRFVAGWMRTGDVAVHTGGTVNYLLDKPSAAGAQMVLLPDPSQPLSAMTLEARPAVGNDDFLERQGVAVHVVDQVARTGHPLSGISTGRRQRQAMGEPESYAHVVRVGQQRTVNGVTIKVLERRGDKFMVQVSGSYRMPGAAYFAEGPVFLSCAHRTADTAMDAGCEL